MKTDFRSGGRNIKILILSFFYPPDVGPGAWRSHALVQELKRQGKSKLKIEVLATTPNRYPGKMESSKNLRGSPRNLRIHRVEVPLHKGTMLDQIKIFWPYAQKAFRLSLSGRWQIIYATSGRLMTALLGAILAWKTGAKLYLDIRDLFPETMRDLLQGSVLRHLVPVLTGLQKIAVARASRVNVVSEAFFNGDLSEVPDPKRRNFMHGVETRFVFPKTRIRKKRIKTYLYAGNFGEGQGLHNTVPKVAKKLEKRARFICIGHGRRQAELIMECKKAGLSNVEVLRPVPQKRLACLYRKADVLFLQLNNCEAFKKSIPSKLFEYAATNKPILAGVQGYCKQFIRENLRGVHTYSPGNIRQMARAILKMNRKTYRIDRAFFCQKFSRKKILKDMAKDILALATEPGHPCSQIRSLSK